MRTTTLMTLMTAMAGGIFPAMADGDAYTLNLSRGKFPSDVVTANLNGTEPDLKAYARGWTDQGWTVNRLDDRGYVALSPTYAPGAECENLLALPPFRVEAGMELGWQAKSVYRHFPESYRVEAKATDGSDAVVLATVDAEEFAWTDRTLDLSPLAGQEVSLRFITTSTEGYMLALSDVRAGEPLTAEPDEEPSGEEPAEGFVRKLVVDHGTGMWCTNCPAVEADLWNLADLYGDRVVMLNTHVNDALGNPGYWAELGWYAVPQMMLNRIQATSGGTTSKFKDYIDRPTDFAVSAWGMPSDEGFALRAEVKVAKETANADGRYRVAFVLTSDYHDPTNPDFVQQNGSSQPSAGAFYYLPKLVAPPLMYYEDVTLTSETAFSGIEDSLPATLEPGETYTVEWTMPAPELLEDPAKARVVGLVLDTQTGEILNADARMAGEKPGAGVATAADTARRALRPIHGGIAIDVAGDLPWSAALYSADGRLLAARSGEGPATWTPRSGEGIRIIVLTTQSGTQTLKTTLK